MRRFRSRIMYFGRGVLGKSFNHLLGGPLARRRPSGDVEVHDAPALVCQDKKDVQNAKRSPWVR